MWKFLFAMTVLFPLVYCTNINQNTMNNEINQEHPVERIIESVNPDAADKSADTTDVQDFDYVVSEAAVGKINGVSFTVAGFETKAINGAEVVSTYLDVDKKEFVDVENGTEFMLNKETKLKVVKLIAAVAPDTKGKIYFKVLSVK